MDNKELSMERAREWLSDKYDKATREAVADMIKNDPQEVVESFHKDLEFGTGGMRGIMGVGTNRMNKYTIGAATQGLADKPYSGNIVRHTLPRQPKRDHHHSKPQPAKIQRLQSLLGRRQPGSASSR